MWCDVGSCTGRGEHDVRGRMLCLEHALIASVEAMSQPTEDERAQFRSLADEWRRIRGRR